MLLVSSDGYLFMRRPTRWGTQLLSPQSWPRSKALESTMTKSWMLQTMSLLPRYWQVAFDVDDWQRCSDRDVLCTSFSQGASVFCIITKMIMTENQVQGYCPEVGYHWHQFSCDLCFTLTLLSPLQLSEISIHSIPERNNTEYYLTLNVASSYWIK